MPTANDIQTFEFTHLEMAVIGAAISQFYPQIAMAHAMGHAIKGECHGGEKTIMNACKRIAESLNSKVDPAIINGIVANAMEGKYPDE